MRIPLLAPLAVFALGAWTARLAAFNPLEAFTAAVVLTVLGLIALRTAGSRLATAALLCAFALCGITLASLSPAVPLDRVDIALAEDLGADDRTVRLRGWVRRPAEALEDADRFVLEMESAYEGTRTSGGVLTTVYRREGDPPLELHYGERLEFLARVRAPRNFGNPGAFDRVGWLAEQGIHATATVREQTPLLASTDVETDWLEARLWELRLAARRRFAEMEARAVLQGSASAGIVRAMTLGDARVVDPDTRSEFERSGAYHVLVVSGMHVGLLAALAIALVRATGAPIFIAWWAGAATAFGYALLLDSALPVSRAAWMLAAYLAASAVYRRRLALNVICGVALAFLCWEPHWLADAGFQLSFLSVAAIAGIGGPLTEQMVRPRQLALRDIWNRDRDLRLPVDVVERRIVMRDWIEPLAQLVGGRKEWLGVLLLGPLRLFWAGVSIVLVSAVITMVLAGPLVYHFQRLALAAPLANLAVLPLLSVIAPAGFAALLTGWLPAYGLATGAADMLAAWVRGMSQLETLQYLTPPPHALWMAASLAACIWLAGALGRSRRQTWMAGIAAAGCVWVIAAYPFAADLALGRLELTAIDVGQGEALLVGLPDGEAGLVDAGGFPNFRDEKVSTFDVGERIVAPYLGERGLKTLAFLAITHADADHMDGAMAVLRRFRPKELWLPHYPLEMEFRLLLDAAREERVTVRFLENGQSFTEGDATVETLFCALCEKRNDQSLILAFDYGQHRFLLTGDIEQAGEQFLMRSLNRKPVAVLKAPHHGSRSSSSQTLLDYAQPQVVLISAGYRNLYGHPHQETLERLKRSGTVLLRTDLDGASTVMSDGKQLWWTTFGP